METQGYLIVQKTKFLLRWYKTWVRANASDPDVHWSLKELRRYRRVFRKFNPLTYRGISREPLDEMIMPKRIVGPYEPVKKDIRAKRLMQALQQERRAGYGEADASEAEYDEDLFVRLDDAQTVRWALDRPSQWEIILVRRSGFSETDSFLGFDVGYWGGDHFSLIADILVIPMWHKPPASQYAEVARQLQKLNEHLLFGTITDAETYREYYRSREARIPAETEEDRREYWAEGESCGEGEFRIIQVDRVPIE